MTDSGLKPIIVLTMLMTLPIVASAPLTPLARGNPASFTLYGRILPLNSAGWGSTAATISSPGPKLTVQPGESVTMSLFSADGISHNFGVDYNGNGIRDPNEPLSGFFGAGGITFSFTATTTPGSYTYYCFLHGDPMLGPFNVASPITHDVAVTALTTSRNFAYNNVPSNPIQVNVTATNKGTATENFFVSATANAIVIGNQSVTVPAGGTTKVTFNWHPENLPRGNYQLRAQATTVFGETSTADNSLDGSIFTVRFKGDVSGDCNVNIIDLSTVGANFGKTSTSPTFNPSADLNNDDTINILDLVIVGGSFGQTCA